MTNAMTASLAFCPMNTAPENEPVILVSAWGQKAVAIWDQNCWRYGPNPGDTWEADYPIAWVPVHACGWITTSARSAAEALGADAVTPNPPEVS